jgi:hypothetical protein
MIGDTIRMLRLQALTIRLVEQNFFASRPQSQITSWTRHRHDPQCGHRRESGKLKTYFGA